MIIGITGTIGSGKGTIAKYLSENFQFKHLSVRDFLVERLEEPTRENMIKLANQLREENGPEYIVMQLYEVAQLYPNSIIESIRNPGEVLPLREKDDFLLLGIDADIEIRYERIRNRGGCTDNKTFEEFKREEERELSSNNPNEQNINKCMEMADIVIYNNGSIKELFSELEKNLNSYEFKDYIPLS